MVVQLLGQTRLRLDTTLDEGDRGLRRDHHTGDGVTILGDRENPALRSDDADGIVAIHGEQPLGLAPLVADLDYELESVHHVFPSSGSSPVPDVLIMADPLSHVKRKSCEVGHNHRPGSPPTIGTTPYESTHRPPGTVAEGAEPHATRLG